MLHAVLFQCSMSTNAVTFEVSFHSLNNENLSLHSVHYSAQNMATISLEQQISKLGHRLPDVRSRAMDSILLKIDSNLISIDHLCSGTVGIEVVNQCMKWLSNNDNRADFGSALRLLEAICKTKVPKTECVQLMLDRHFPSFLHRFSMEHQLGHTELQRIQSIIGVLINCPRPKDSDRTEAHRQRDEVEASPLYPAQHRVKGVGSESASGALSGSISDRNKNAVSNSKPFGDSQSHRLFQKSKHQNSWRFPSLSVIRGDAEHLFDLSLRLKVQNESICEYGLLQFEWLSICHFPPEIVVQSDLHLLESLRSILQRDPSSDEGHSVSHCLQSLTVWTQRMAHSLRLRCDSATMSHPASKLIDGGSYFDEWRHPNDLSAELIQNRMPRTAVQCTSISEMAHQLIAASTSNTELLTQSTTRNATLRLIERVTDRFVFVDDHCPSSSMMIDIVAAFAPYTESVDMSIDDVFVHRIVHFVVKCLSNLFEIETADIDTDRIPQSVIAVLTQYAVTTKLTVLYPELHSKIKAILHRLDPATHRKLQYVGAVVAALETLREFEGDTHRQPRNGFKSFTLNRIRSTFIAMPFHLDSVNAVIQCLMTMDNMDCDEAADSELSELDGIGMGTDSEDEQWRHCVSMLLLSPSSHITMETLNCIISHIRRHGVPDRLLCVDILYVLLTLIPKHSDIAERVQSVLEMIYSHSAPSKRHSVETIFLSLYPLMSLFLGNCSFQSVLQRLDLKQIHPLLSALRLCFHSDRELRIRSHRKIANFYAKSLCLETESEEKRQQIQSETDSGFSPLDLDIDQERARMDEMARICGFDFFHFDDFRKCAEKYHLQKQESMASLKNVSSGSFVRDEVDQMISVLTNQSLECHLRIAAGEQLLTVFLKDRRFWSILRDQKLLNSLIRCVRVAIVRMEGGGRLGTGKMSKMLTFCEIFGKMLENVEILENVGKCF